MIIYFMVFWVVIENRLYIVDETQFWILKIDNIKSKDNMLLTRLEPWTYRNCLYNTEYPNKEYKSLTITCCWRDSNHIPIRLVWTLI